MSNFLLVNQLKQLLNLQQQKNAANQTIQDIVGQIDQLNTQQERLEKIKKHAHTSFLQLQKTVHEQQEELAAITQEERLRRTQLDNERKSDAIHTLSVAVSRLEGQRRSLEARVEQQWKEMEQSKQRLDVLDQESAIKADEIKQNLQALDGEKHLAQQVLPALEAQILAVLNSVPEEIRLQLVAMDRQAALAIAKIIDNVCSNCFYPLTNRDMAIMLEQRNDQISTCKNCFTILYIDDNHE